MGCGFWKWEGDSDEKGVVNEGVRKTVMSGLQELERDSDESIIE